MWGDTAKYWKQSWIELIGKKNGKYRIFEVKQAHPTIKMNEPNPKSTPPIYRMTGKEKACQQFGQVAITTQCTNLETTLSDP